MNPVPVQRIGSSAAPAPLMAIVRILAIAGVFMGSGVAIMLLEPILLVAFDSGSMARNANWLGYGLPGFPYRGNTVYIAAASAILLIFSAIATLTLRPGGRIGLIWYGIISVTHLAVLIAVPTLYNVYHGIPVLSFTDVINTVRQLTIMATMIASFMVYPALVLAVMRLSAVAEMFARGGTGFEVRFRPIKADRGEIGIEAARAGQLVTGELGASELVTGEVLTGEVATGAVEAEAPLTSRP